MTEIEKLAEELEFEIIRELVGDVTLVFTPKKYDDFGLAEGC